MIVAKFGTPVEDMFDDIRDTYSSVVSSKFAEDLARSMASESSYLGGSLEWSDRSNGIRLYIDVMSDGDNDIIVSISGSDISFDQSQAPTVNAVVQELRDILL